MPRAAPAAREPVARAFMPPVDILRDERELRTLECPAREHLVRVIRLCARDQSAAPVVPLPHELRVFLEGFRCRKRLGAEVLPEAVGAAELARCREIGATMAAGLSLGIY